MKHNDMDTVHKMSRDVIDNCHLFFRLFASGIMILLSGIMLLLFEPSSRTAEWGGLICMISGLLLCVISLMVAVIIVKRLEAIKIISGYSQEEIL